MSVTTINHQEAFQVVRSARTAANPNIGFQRQLYEFEISGASNKVSFSLSVRATKGIFTEIKILRNIFKDNKISCELLDFISNRKRDNSSPKNDVLVLVHM